MRRQLIAGAVAMGLLVSSICASALWRSWDAAMQRADAEAANLAILIDHNVSSILDKASVVLASTAAQLEREIAARGIDRSAIGNLEDGATALVPEIAQIGVFDAQGQQVCGEQQPSRCRRLQVADRDYFRGLRDAPGSEVRLFGPYPDRVDQRNSFVLARALRDGSGAFAGVAIAVLPVQDFAAVLGAADLGRGGVVTLRNAGLELVLRHPQVTERPPHAAGATVSEAFARAVNAAPDEGRYRGASALDGIERQIHYRRLRGFALYVVVGLATNEFLKPWRTEAMWTGIFLALLAASSAVTARLHYGATQDRERIQELYDGAPCGYHSLDADGTFRRINATELRWLGCSREQVIGKLAITDFLSDESRATFGRHFPEFLRSGRIEGVELDLVGRDGTVRRVVVSATALHDEQGRITLTNSVLYDISELHAARRDLRELAARLEERVEQRTHELRLLAAELDAAQTRERQQIARDLHDDLGQTLAAARIHLGELKERVDGESRHKALRVDELIEGATRATRSLAAQLTPPMLDDLGLAAALEWLGEEIERNFGLEVSVVDDGQDKPLSPEARSILYRATRELLINAAKHSGTHQAEVEVERRNHEIVVRVADGGAGFDAKRLTAAKGQGMGLLSVRERLSFIGGSVALRSIPGEGTVVTLTAPLASASEAGWA
ncbi:MAG: PAS domain-containing protein [Burkholderiales bacterium]|nr:PAS domain-containing protein [Burkholderiales bacterium]